MSSKSINKSKTQFNFKEVGILTMLRTIQITEGNYRKVADSIFFNLCAVVVGIFVYISWSNSGVADEGTRLGYGWALLAIAAGSVAVAFGTPQRFCCNAKALMLCRSIVAGSALHIGLHVTMGMRFGMDRCSMTKADAVVISCVSVIGSIVGLVGIVLSGGLTGHGVYVTQGHTND